VKNAGRDLREEARSFAELEEKLKEGGGKAKNDKGKK